MKAGRLSAGARGRHGAVAGCGAVDGAGGAGPALSLLRQCEAAQLVVPGQQRRTVLRGLPHNRMIPDLTVPDNLAHWRLMETAKHRLFYTLLKLNCRSPPRAEDPDGLGSISSPTARRR
jgi:hypothetical protein